jgi:hypothetical protein
MNGVNWLVIILIKRCIIQADFLNGVGQEFCELLSIFVKVGSHCEVKVKLSL